MSAALTLTQMADLALGTPEVGAVNFNVLHTLLHAMIQKLGIADVKTEITKSDKDFLTRKRDDPDAFSTAETDVSDRESAVTGITDDSGLGGRSARPPYHHLEDKVAKLEKQLNELNELPSNQTLYDRTHTRGENEKPTPVSDMWQAMQLKNRVDANEGGVSKLMSLVEHLMTDMQELKTKANNFDDILDRLKTLENLHAELRDHLADSPDFVTWDSLENYLKGIRESIEELNNRDQQQQQQQQQQQEELPPQKIVSDMFSQTEMSRPNSSRAESTPRPGSSRPGSSRPGSSRRGPSVELQGLLEHLGVLTDRHDKLEIRVDNCEKELANKADKADKADALPPGLLDQLKSCEEAIAQLKRDMERDSAGVQQMQKNLASLQNQLQRLDELMAKLMEQSKNQQTNIDELYKKCATLDENKADKSYVQAELDMKADKRLVEGKVNRSLFDSTCDELNKMINDILAKLAASEDEWKKLLAQLEDKLDRLEFSALKDELEKQLRALAKRLKDMGTNYDHCDDDAAGIRKQLLQRFNCISCDRPVDMMPQGPVPSIPQSNALPSTRSARPYTTYELEQIRQHAKSPSMLPFAVLDKKYSKKKMSNFERAILENRIARCHMHDLRAYLVHFGKDFAQFSLTGPSMLRPLSQSAAEPMDLYQTSRACGGSHTLTYPHRRTSRAQHLNNLFREDSEVTIVPSHKGELDIQGADGHIYRGRGQLPHVPQWECASKYVKKWKKKVKF